ADLRLTELSQRRGDLGEPPVTAQGSDECRPQAIAPVPSQDEAGELRPGAELLRQEVHVAELELGGQAALEELSRRLRVFLLSEEYRPEQHGLAFDKP